LTTCCEVYPSLGWIMIEV